jgi:hypothetical protein
LSKSVWVEARELKFCMLYLFNHLTAYSDLEFVRKSLKNFLKNSKIFWTKCQKLS